MNIVDQLDADLKEATKLRDQVRLDVLRMLKSALKNQQIEVGHELTMPEVLAVLQKEAKKRQDAVEAYQTAGRTDLADKESAEAKTIEQYLPAQLNDEELGRLVDEAIASTGAQSKADLGRVMSEVMAKVSGQADGRRVSQIVSQKLQ